MNGEKRKACAFTGHRPNKLPTGESLVRLEKMLYSIIEELIREEDVSHFISGMAQGIDMMAAEAVLALRYKYPHITLESAVPCNGQHSNWSEESKEAYRNILRRADKVSLLQGEYTRDCMMKRNKYMVNRSEFLVAVWNGTSGGTKNTVSYALKEHKKGKSIKIFKIDPDTMKLEILTEQKEPEQISLQI